MKEKTMVKPDAEGWAEEIFGQSELGDKRRTRRLVQFAGQLAAKAGVCPSQACEGDSASAEGAYRLLRNEDVKPDAMAAAGFQATVAVASQCGELLAVEDTTTLGYDHKSVAEALGDLGGKAGSGRRGFFVHSVVLLERVTGQTVGLVEQERWCREEEKRGQRHDRKTRPYATKESYKWQRASERMQTRLGPHMTRVISVCDREADVYEYLRYKTQAQQRYIVRASWDRGLAGQAQRLNATLEAAPVLGEQDVFIPQRGGRRSRTAQVVLSSARVTLNPPKRQGEVLSPLEVNAVLVRETAPPADSEPLRWLMLSSEPVDTSEAVKDIVKAYGLRWRVEDFHKAWKTGAGIELFRMQSAGNLERAAVITAFIAVRLLQLRERLEHWEQAPNEPEPLCDEVLSDLEWKVLYTTTTKKPPPETAPSLSWAYQTIAKLGGWLNTKRTGRASWKTMWDGWYRLQDRVEAARLVQEMF